VQVRGLQLALTRPGSDTEQQILTDINLDIKRGEVVGLVGQSGSGKSMIGLAMLGLLPERSAPRVSGSILVDGVDVVTASPAQLRNLRRHSLGVVFQDPMTSLDPTMRIGRQVMEVAGSKAEAVRLLELVGIPQAATRLSAYPHELSGGLRQRVMIAIAVAGAPSLIIADEPTTALDVTVQKQVLELLRNLKDEMGCSILMVTHDLGVAGEIADRVVVMNAGSIVEEGPVGRILTTPSAEYTQRLLGSRVTLASDRFSSLPAVNPGDPDAAPADIEVYEPFAGGPDTPIGVAATGIAKTFRRRGAGVLPALDGVDLTVRAGESVAIVGESGSGKSTLLRIIAGLETASAGTVTVAAKGTPQMVFQDAGASLTPWLTVRELLAERLHNEGIPSREHGDRIRAVLALVGMDESAASAKASELSGGQRQRIALARATVLPPSVLLCDEPTSALDAWIAGTVINLLRHLHKRLGMSMIFVTHDLGVARLIADRIVVMRQGQVIEEGDADAIISSPQQAYTRALVDAVPGGVESRSIAA
jgi:peptide/nickel transport system ATP-binding protein